MTQSEVGARIRQARETKQLTQAELAERAGLPPAAISHFETGNRLPGTSTLRKLADELGVSLDFLLGRFEEPKASGPNQEALYRDLRDLSDHSLDVVQGIIKHLKEKDEKERGEG